MATTQNDRDLILQSGERLKPITILNNLALPGGQLSGASVITSKIAPFAVSSLGFVQRQDFFNIPNNGVWTNVVATELFNLDNDEQFLFEMTATIYGGTVDLAAGTSTANTASTNAQYRVIKENAINFTGITTEILSLGAVIVVGPGARETGIRKRLLSAPGAPQVRITLQAFCTSSAPPYSSGMTTVTVQQIKR